jgi:hypothetical protein
MKTALAFILALLFTVVATLNLFNVACCNPAQATVKIGPYALRTWIKSPSNKTYVTDTIQLQLSASCVYNPFECRYRVDDGPYINVPKTESNSIGGGVVDTNISLTLQDGSHTIVAEAVTDEGVEVKAVACISFTINTVLPYLSIMSPENKTYETSNIPLNFTVNEALHPVSQITYSLDGLENVSIVGNITLTGLAYGEHNVTVFARDEAGNVGAPEKVFFAIAESSPTPTPYEEPQLTEQEVILGVAITAAVLAVGLGLLLHLIKRK